MQRILGERDYTLGILSFDALQCSLFVLEDEHRDQKVPGETCIPAGHYALTIRKVETALTLKYRKRFPWFKYHIEVDGVRGFDNIYIHVGNTDEDTKGCLLLGLDASLDKPNGQISRSVQAYELFYKSVYPMLERGDDIYIDIKD